MRRRYYETHDGTLRCALDDYYRADELRRLAKQICSHVPTRKGEVIDEICRNMQGANLKSLFNRLNTIEKSAVAEAIHSYRGELDSESFRSKYGSTPWDDAKESYSRYSSNTPHTILDLFIVGSKVPDDLSESLKTFIPAPEADSVKCLQELPALFEKINYRDRKKDDFDEEVELTVRHTERAALQNLEAVLRLADGGKLKVGPKTGRPTAATMAVISKILYEGDWYDGFDQSDIIGPIQSFAWPLILQGGGLAKASGTTLQLSRSGKKVLGGDLPAVIRAAWQKWENTKIIDEFSRIDAIKGQKSSRGRAMTSPVDRRPKINDALGTCPEGKWIHVDELGRYMRAEGFKFDVARDLWRLYICEQQYGSLGYAGCGDWPIVEGRYLLAFLFEYAATLGLIDVAYISPVFARDDYHGNWGADELIFLSRYDGLQYFRINALGAYVFEWTDRYEAPPVENRSILKVLPNHEIVITDKVLLTEGDRLFLEKISDKVSSSVRRLSVRSLLGAAEKGTNPEEILSFLQSHATGEIPETVLSLLGDAAERTTCLSYSGRSHIITCADPLLASMIAADRKLKKLCMAAGEGHIAVLPGKEKAFLKALADLGYIVPGLRDQI